MTNADHNQRDCNFFIAAQTHTPLQHTFSDLLRFVKITFYVDKTFSSVTQCMLFCVVIHIHSQDNTHLTTLRHCVVEDFVRL